MYKRKTYPKSFTCHVLFIITGFNRQNYGDHPRLLGHRRPACACVGCAVARGALPSALYKSMEV